MVLTCADDGELAEHPHRSTWAGTQATATGFVTWRACSAACADSKHWDRARAYFTLTGPKPEPGKKVLFTRLTMHVTGPTPRGFLRNLAFDEAPAATPPPRLPAKGHATPPAPPSAAPSGSLGYAQIKGFWGRCRGPYGQPGQLHRRSDRRRDHRRGELVPARIIQPGVDYCGSGSDRAWWGLWQITCGNSAPVYGTDFQLLDPWNNAEVAVYKYDADVQAGYDGFDPWSTYTDGAYTRYLQSTAADTQLTYLGQYVQINSTPPGTPSSPCSAPEVPTGRRCPARPPPMPSGRARTATCGKRRARPTAG